MNAGPADSFGREFWERRWSEVRRDHPDMVAQRGPSAYVTSLAAGLSPGRVLDAGCGNGAEALWLATQGWHVTAVDFSEAALRHGRATAEKIGPDVAARVTWLEGDLGVWSPVAGAYDLVCSLYVHVAGSLEEMVTRLAEGVAAGGTILLVGHLAIDPTTGAETPAAGQVQVTVEDAVAALHPRQWEISIAEERARTAVGSGFDAVVCARRLI